LLERLLSARDIRLISDNNTDISVVRQVLDRAFRTLDELRLARRTGAPARAIGIAPQT